MKLFFNYIGSRKFAIYLLVATTAVILLSNLLPNLAIMDSRELEKLKSEKPMVYAMSVSWNVNSVTSSPYFQILPAFLFLSISLCTLKRFRGELGRVEKGETLPANPSVQHRFTLMDLELDIRSMLTILKAKGWKAVDYPLQSNIIYARKGEKGIWGSFCFHIGMNVALIGILISAMTSFDGSIALTEGFPISTPADIRGTDNTKAEDFPFEQMLLESFMPKFSEGFPVEYNSKIVVVDSYGQAKRYTIKVNSPLEMWNYKFIFKEASYAPRLILRDKDGKLILDTVVNLVISMPGVVDFFDVPDEGLRIKVEMFPDYYNEGGKHNNKGIEPKNPALFVEIERWDKMIGRGFLFQGKMEDFGDYAIEFVELRHWMKLVVSKDFGVSVIIAGFILISAGLGLRFISNDKSLWVMPGRGEGEPVWEMGGRSMYFPALFAEEMARLAEELRNRGGKL